MAFSASRFIREQFKYSDENKNPVLLGAGLVFKNYQWLRGCVVNKILIHIFGTTEFMTIGNVVAKLLTKQIITD